MSCLDTQSSDKNKGEGEIPEDAHTNILRFSRNEIRVMLSRKARIPYASSIANFLSDVWNNLTDKYRWPYSVEIRIISP